MFKVYNERLIELIKNSFALKEKLTDQQIQKFIDKSLSLPPEGQNELIQKLEEEVKLIKNDEESRNANIEAIRNYSEKVNKIVEDFKKVTFQNAEKYSVNEDEMAVKELIKNAEEEEEE